MDDNNVELRALEPGELDIFVRCAEPSNIEELGSKLWVECHLRFHKLQQQAVLEAAGCQEEATRDAIISYGKIPILIHEAICISIWRIKIFPKILQIEKNLSNTFLLYSVMYHETVAVGLLEVILFDEEACGAIPDVLVDLIDYSVERVIDVIALVNIGYLKPKPDIVESDANNIDELLLQQKNLQFDIGMRCITIVSCLANLLDKIHVSASSRLYGNHDVPLLLAEILNKEPWQKIDDKGNIQRFIDGRWKVISDKEADQICRCETLAWIALLRLILNPDINKYYEINNFRKTELCKLVYKISDSHMDQIPMLIELKRSLGQLATADVSFAQTKTKKPLLIEVVAEIKTSILKKIYKKTKSIAKSQMENYFKPDKSEMMELAKMLSCSYSSEVLEHLDDGGAKCASCGDQAAKKCSRCKTEWYCGRECQVKRWPNHKDICDQFSLITK